MFLTEIQIPFHIYKDSAELNIAEIRHPESVPSSLDNDIAVQRYHIKRKRCFN